MNILINALGIDNSGGVTVFNKLLNEIYQDTRNQYLIVCNDGVNSCQYKLNNNLLFIVVSNNKALNRLYYENIKFNGLVEKYKIQLIYNFSGSVQIFIKIPQLIKVHNLIFYSKKLNAVYRKNSQLILWVRQVYLKRLIFKFMLSKSKHIEIQSKHVKACLLDFINTREKFFYVKSDINVSNIEFYKPKQYDFSKKIKFLYIVGPHFEYIHKNFIDFTNTLLELDSKSIDFKVNITLTSEQLNNSKVWDYSLNSKTNFLGYISDQEKMKELFCDNTILISTSVIETLGLHVIEGIKNGVITIAPDEEYANTVYGGNIFQYELFNRDSLVDTIISVINCKEPYSENILSIQDDLRKSEMSKFGSILDVFDEVLNVKK
jgi:glycosyltransferase involved in cell wall biosynthesis